MEQTQDKYKVFKSATMTSREIDMFIEYLILDKLCYVRKEGRIIK